MIRYMVGELPHQLVSRTKDQDGIRNQSSKGTVSILLDLSNDRLLELLKRSMDVLLVARLLWLLLDVEALGLP